MEQCRERLVQVFMVHAPAFTSCTIQTRAVCAFCWQLGAVPCRIDCQTAATHSQQQQQPSTTTRVAGHACYALLPASASVVCVCPATAYRFEVLYSRPIHCCIPAVPPTMPACCRAALQDTGVSPLGGSSKAVVQLCRTVRLAIGLMMPLPTAVRFTGRIAITHCDSSIWLPAMMMGTIGPIGRLAHHCRYWKSLP
jgi:hypothetical protein